MAKIKVMNGVTHDIAHHAQSGLSWLCPRLSEAGREAGVLTASVDRFDERPYPLGLREKPPLVLALTSMRHKLGTILEKHGCGFADVTFARLSSRSRAAKKAKKKR